MNEYTNIDISHFILLYSDSVKYSQRGEKQFSNSAFLTGLLIGGMLDHGQLVVLQDF